MKLLHLVCVTAIHRHMSALQTRWQNQQTIRCEKAKPARKPSPAIWRHQNKMKRIPAQERIIGATRQPIPKHEPKRSTPPQRHRVTLTVYTGFQAITAQTQHAPAMFSSSNAKGQTSQPPHECPAL
jgi:hypothetical protein